VHYADYRRLGLGCGSRQKVSQGSIDPGMADCCVGGDHDVMTVRDYRAVGQTAVVMITT